MYTPKGYKAIITLESRGWLLGGTRRHESSVFTSKEDAESFAAQSEDVNRNRPGYQDAVILTRVEPVYHKIGRTRLAKARKIRIRCNQCEACMINGVFCHETGCPNSGSRYDIESGEWIKQRKCFECGCTVDNTDLCCSVPFEEDEN